MNYSNINFKKNRYKTRLLYSAFLPFILASGCGLVPLKIDRNISLKTVEIRKNSIKVVDTNIEKKVRESSDVYLFGDNELQFTLQFEQNFLFMDIYNKSDSTINILWGESNFIDDENISYQLSAAGGASIFAGKQKMLAPSIPRSATVKLKLTPHVGTSTVLGITRPLYKIHRHDKEKAIEQARELVGKSIRIIIKVEVQGIPREYTFICKLVRVTVDGEVVSL